MPNSDVVAVSDWSERARHASSDTGSSRWVSASLWSDARVWHCVRSNQRIVQAGIRDKDIMNTVLADIRRMKPGEV